MYFYLHRLIKSRANFVKIIENLGWLLYDKIIRLVVGLVIGVWLARYLGPGEYGLFNYALSVVGLFGAFASLGLEGIVVRDLVYNNSPKEETIGTAAFLMFLGGLIAYIFILLLINWYQPNEIVHKVLIAILGTIVILKGSEVALYWFESQVMSKYVIWMKTCSFLTFAVIKLYLILMNASLIAFAWATLGEALLTAILIMIALNLHGIKIKNLKVTINKSKYLLVNSWPLMLTGISTTIYMVINQIMLGQMLDNNAVGIYSAAIRISEIWYFF